MHCVFRAYEDHLRYLDLPAKESDWVVYRRIKGLLQGNADEYTREEFVPIIFLALSRKRNLQMKIQHRIGPDFHLYNKQYPLSLIQKAAVKIPDWGEHLKSVTFKNAVYCSPLYAHAEFASSPVEGTSLAIKLWRSL